MNLSLITHPEYDLHFIDWLKWRLAYTGGRRFLVTYLQKFSSKESVEDFDQRLAISYVPAFAKEAVNEVRDSIYNRMSDISREGGSQTYQDAVKGVNGGVDLFGSSMNYFMGCRILPELLVMQRVGIYVDYPERERISPSLRNNKRQQPYLYMFSIEDIRAWQVDETNHINDFSSLLLRERVNVEDEETGFPVKVETRYRRFWKGPDGNVMVAFHRDDEGNTMINQYGEPTTEPIALEINRIPFIILDIKDSLMTDIADYQVSLLNLASSDMVSAFRNNFPFYTEQYDPVANAAANQRPTPSGTVTGQTLTPKPDANASVVPVGATKGRKYAKGLERPGFINPSPDPLKVSMEKQEQLKFEIRQLRNLTLTNLRPSATIGAESKKQDSRGVENGLGYIGLTLESAERKAAEYWDLYERKSQIATVNYPEDYRLLGEAERREESIYLEDLQNKIPSPTFQKACQKRIAKIALGTKVSREEFIQICQEIDDAPTISANPETLISSVENGICTTELAAKVLGYPEGESKKAESEHERRLERIALSQTKGAGASAAARGTPDGDPDPSKSGKNEKTKSQDKTQSGDLNKKVRGKE